MLTDHQFNLILESLDQKEKIKLWLDKMKIKNYKINEDLTVDVDGSVDISSKKLKEIPVQFNKVSGDFWCSNNQLTILEGAPKSVGGSFWCDYNQLITLEGAPESINSHFNCHYNQLTTLEGAPENVGGHFGCFNNPLKSLEGKPGHVGGGFHIDLVTYNRIFRKNKEWSLDDVDEVPVGYIDIKDKIY